MIRGWCAGVLALLLVWSASPVQARMDEAELALIRAYAAQEQEPLLFTGTIAKEAVVAAPGERDAGVFLRSRKMLLGEMQQWDARVRIFTAWPDDQEVRAISGGFMEIVDLGRFYYQFDGRSSRAEAVQRLLSSDAEGIAAFIRGMELFERKYLESAGEGLRSTHDSMRRVAIVYLREVVRFLDNRYNRALLDLYNENRQAYLNRHESRYAQAYLDSAGSVIDYARLSRLNDDAATPLEVARQLALLGERFEEVGELLDDYLKEQRKLGQTAHAERLRQGFDLLREDFQRSVQGFKNKYPSAARKNGL